MSDEINIKIASYGDGRNLMMVYFDPLTGKKVAKSSGTTDRGEAQKAAGKWEDELNTGRYQAPSRLTWKEFRRRYEAEKGATLSANTLLTFRSAANHLERELNPDRLVKLTPAALSRFQAKLRADGKGEVTIGIISRHLRAALSWGVDVGLLPAVPKMVIPRAGGARARAVSGEEFDRLLLAVPKVRPDDAPAWDFYLRGLYLGGLRLRESLALS